MAYKISLSPKAYIDISYAFEYYSVSKQTLINFDKELEIAYSTLSQNPHFRIRYKNITGFPLKKFPYLLLYEIDETEQAVYIYSVFNTNLDPKKYPGK